MVCPRGKASPNAQTQRRLFAASAGYCQNPSCLQELFRNLPSGKSIHIAEMAHVFAATVGGPRSNPELSIEQRGAFENLILLCVVCHTQIDKAPDDFPDNVILNWKTSHAAKLQGVFGVVTFDDRPSLRSQIDPILRENRAIFDAYGPEIDVARNPESGASERWRRKMLMKIIPNNRRILSSLDHNILLLTDSEIRTLEQFRQHIDDLEARHIEGFKDGAQQFPKGMKAILRD